MVGGIQGKLSDKTVKAFVAKAEPGKKLPDGGGLYLFIPAAGNANWRIKYRIEGKERVYSAGTYPLVSLAAARIALSEAKALIREGKDPVAARRLNRAATAASAENTFQSVAQDWLTMKQKEWSAGHYTKSARAFERDIYPAIGKLPIANITPAMVAKAIEDIHKRDVLETASRILQHLNGVFRYAQAKGLCRDNPAAPAREVLPRKKDSGRMPALLDWAALGDVLRRADMARLSPSVRMAHRLCAFTAARIGNVVNAQWREFHLDDEQPVWVIPREKMKVTTRDIDHRVPLCPEITAELKQWREVFGGRGYVFPSPSGGKFIGRESIEKVYRVTLGLEGKHSPHGWRSAFSTLARDQGFARDVVELALDHAHDNDVARAYDRGERFTQRAALFNWWGEQLAAAQRGAKIIPLLNRVSGEVSVHTAAMETRIKVLANRAKELLEQNLRVQKRLFELETLVDVRALTMMRARSRGTSEAVAFDPLEMDQYSELHSTTHALVEEASDARVMALNVEEAVAQLSSLQNRQQVLARDLQHLVVGTRMSEVGAMESRLQRNVRTTCQTTGKQATLELRGGDTLIDSDVLSRLADPLLHLLRNAVDHGIEAPAERIAAGKPEAGRILLEFSQQGQQIAMRCTDDGRGLDYLSIQRRAVERGLMTPGQSLSMDEIARFVLMPGFSTRDAVSEVSGRGVGLDVVRDWVASMNGSVRIGSKQGQGCTIELRFSASLSTIHSLIVETGGQRFALPAIQVEQAVPRGMGNIEQMGDRLIFHYQKRALPATRLAEIVGLPVDLNVPLENYDFVIVKHGDGIQALAVDQLLDARDLLVNNPGRYARHVRGVAGLSILGDGSVAVNLDLTQLVAGNLRRTTVVAAGDQSRPRTQTTQITLPGVLIVDDALTVRNSLQQLLEDSGFRAATARDGIDAINTLADFHADIVLTDLEMPNMNGVELTTHIRGRDDLKNLPVIMITSRSQDKHRQLAEKAGVNAYITKPYNEGDLLNTIRQSIAA